MDPNDFQRLVQAAQTPQGTVQQAQPTEALGSSVEEQPEDQGLLGGLVDMVMGSEGEETPAAPDPNAMTPEQIEADRNSGILGSINSAIDMPDVVKSMGGGALKSVFETKDFLFGDTKPEDQSSLRRGVEAENEQLTGESPIINGFASGIGQFATAMFGLGKLSKGAQAIGFVGSAMKGAEGVKAGKIALETGKAALAGYISVDPHADRLSNFVQGTPLANPMSAWLAADPSDTASEGRLKNALESIGMDAVIIGTLTLAGKVFKTLRKGDTQAASDAVDEFEAQQKAQLEQADADETLGAGPEPIRADGGAAQVEPLPAGPVDGSNPPPLTQASDGSEVGTAASPSSLPDAERLQGETTGADGSGRSGGQPADDATTAGQGEAGGDGLPKVDLDGNTVEADGRRLPKVRPSQSVVFKDEDTVAVLAKSKADMEAIENYGGRYQAAEAGYSFGQGSGIPYHKFNTDADVDDFAARLFDAKLEEMDKLKGGDILTDESLNKTVLGLAKLTGQDPAKLLGRIQQSGAQARQMAADMEVGWTVGMKMADDAWALNERMLAGDFTAFGSREGMMAEITKMLTLSASFMSPARSIMSNAGRTLRRMRKDIQWIDPQLIKNADPETLSQLLRASKGNPQNMKQLLNPGFWGKASDFVTAVRINSLVSGYLTQFYNVVSSGYMVGVRPMQRIIGATLKGDIRAVDKNMRQYVYMGNALMEGWGTALKAFTDEGLRAGFKAAGDTSVGAAVKSFGKNDSVLKPHSTEVLSNNQGTPGMGQMGPSMLRPIKGMNDLFYNAFAVAGAGLTVPGRGLGAVDELFKQITYRSKLMADAHAEAVMEMAGKNMTPADQKAFVKSYMDNRMGSAFDAKGRGQDAKALREANISTFQQDLLDGTLGKGVQTFASNWPAARWVLPFIKTPTNVIRESWRLTPVLNLAQGEYRQMLMGKMGVEAQQQAMGQMAMGTAFMGAASFLSSTGRITGGGPSDFKAKRELQATGWRPYSVVKLNEDGSKTYIPFNRVDPIATPFGMIADIQDAIHNADWDGAEGTAAEIQTAIGALRIGLMKQFTSKTYLLGLSQFMDAVMDADSNDKALSAFGGIAASLVPYSALTRQTNDDVYMREARSVTDKMRQVIPGQSESLPAQYDWLGDPILARPGLWTSDNGSIVDAEIQRIAQETDKVPFQRVNPNADGVDLRELTLTDGRNAYEVYQQLSGRPTKGSKPLRDAMADLVQRKSYQRAPDGEADIKGTKAYLMAKRITKYRSAAMKVLKRDPKVREAFMTPEQKVRDFYKNLKAQPAEQPSPLGAVGQAYGINTGR